MKKKQNKQPNAPARQGMPEFWVALAVVLLLAVLVVVIRGCDTPSSTESETPDGIMEDTTAPAENTPTSTTLDVIPLGDSVTLPLEFNGGITVTQVYTATGYFPEDGTDEAVENVLAARFTNTTEQTLEYMTATLTVNGEEYPFSLTTVPAGESVYVFNTDRKNAPTAVEALTGEIGYQTFFAKEPTKMEEALAYEIQYGTIVVKNISDSDITSDLLVYYKSTAENGYLGGITYRFRISGGLKAGESFNGYAPHAYAHMTEVMFAHGES